VSSHASTNRIAIVVGDDPCARRHAAELLGSAGFVMRESREGGPDDGVLLVLLLGGEPSERIEAIAAYRERNEGAAVVASMPASVSAGQLRLALRAGADGIVFDEQIDGALVATAGAVAAGQLSVPFALRRQLAPRPLSYREKEVLRLVVQGYTNRQIADALVLAESTVKTHLSSAYGKLDARSRAEAAALVLDPDAGYDLRLGVAPASAA
jgi:DNA-binding NarL/FixJ family response regulator